jgi:cobalt-zinc-cadmium efflux system outer membrane protein
LSRNRTSAPSAPTRGSTSRHYGRPLSRLAVILLFAALLVGCASYESRPLVPRDELERLRTRVLERLVVEQARPGEVPLQVASFDPADGLDEVELIAVALTLNPSLWAKRLEIGEAEALLITAGLWPNPEIGLAVRPGINTATPTDVDLEALFSVLRPNERKARRGVALARLDTVRAEVAALELGVVAQTRKARLGVLAADEGARLLEGEAALREEVSTYLRRRKDLGEATDLDLLVADLELAEIRRELRDAQADRRRARRALNEILGLPASYEIALTGGLSVAMVGIPSDEELDQQLLSRRFDLRAREHQYRQAEEELRLAIARQYPDLRLGPSYEGEEGSSTLGAGIAIDLPLLNQNQGEIAEKYASRERARAEYASVLHALRTAALEARAELERARAEVEVQQREVLPLIERTEALFEGAFRARELSIFEWITARTRALRARRELLRALVRYTGAVADFEAAVGVTPEPRTNDKGKR